MCSRTKTTTWRRLLLVVLLLFSLPSGADVYRWVGEDGRVHFGDRPPAESDSERMELRINTYSAPQIINQPAAAASSRGKAERKVVMYSASWCGVCKKAKAYFDAKRIPYTEYDVETSSRGRRDFKKLGGRGVPIILVGEGRMNGFSVAGFEALYRQ